MRLNFFFRALFKKLTHQKFTSNKVVKVRLTIFLWVNIASENEIPVVITRIIKIG